MGGGGHHVMLGQHLPWPFDQQQSGRDVLLDKLNTYFVSIVTKQAHSDLSGWLKAKQMNEITSGLADR